MEISIVIPVYNEEENLRPLIEGIVPVMDKLPGPYEIILIDDGSTDNSLGVLKELATKYPVIRIGKFAANCGQSAAFTAGFKLAQGATIVALDADLQYDPQDIPKLLEKIGEYDVVCGWRKHRDDPWLKLVSTKIANSVRNKLSGEDIKDIGCSLKAFKREYIVGLKLYKGMHRFFPTLCKMKGARVCEVEVKHFPRKAGESKYNIRNRLFRSFCDLLFVIWMKRRNIDYKLEVIK